jgi:hypothetical protein
VLGRHNFAAGSNLLPLEAALGQLRFAILKQGNHLHDSHDPRLYVFIKVEKQAVGGGWWGTFLL